MKDEKINANYMGGEMGGKIKIWALEPKRWYLNLSWAPCHL